jgi:hypothetical protein
VVVSNDRDVFFPITIVVGGEIRLSREYVGH